MAFHPVRVYKKHPDQGGKVRKVISSRVLKKRADQAFDCFDPRRPAVDPVLNPVCKECNKTYKRALSGQKYCSNQNPPFCGQIAARRRSAERNRNYRKQKRQARQAG